jgi:hypothetical protein
MPPYPAAPGADTFESSRLAFNALVAQLSAESALSLDHADVEELVDQDGTELLRLLLQDHLGLRAGLEEREPVCGSDGVTRTHKRASSCCLESLFGGVLVLRLALSMRGVSALMPMDAELNLPNGRYSHGLRKRVVMEVASGSFDQAVATIRATTGACVSKRQVEESVVDAMVNFDDFYAHATVTPVVAGDFVVLTFDGKGVVMRREGLRPQTRKAADTTEKKLKSRLSPGEKRNRKRMAQVAAVYAVSPWERTTDQVLKVPGCGPLPPRPKPMGKRVWASLVHEPGDVVTEAFDEALARDPHQQRTWVVLVDGNAQQLRYVRKAATELGQPVILILDIIHAIEYIWKAAWAFHDKDDPEVETWVLDKICRLLDGKVSGVAAGIRRSATRRGLTGTRRKAADKCANYLLKHKSMMRYDHYLAAGMPIGTGVIEGACRHLISDRMDITGARWGLERAEAVLQARALRISGDLDAYWAFYRRRELEHNHIRRYAESELPALREAA